TRDRGHRRSGRVYRPVYLAQPLDADPVAGLGSALDGVGDVRRPADADAASVLEQRARHRVPPARAGHRGQRQRQERARRRPRSNQPVRGGRLLRVGDDPPARTPPSRAACLAAPATGRNDMTLTNFLVGVPAMLLCLVMQVVVVFWCVRYCARQSAPGLGDRIVLATIRPLAVSMMAMMTANVLQIALWGWLFLQLGEFEDLYPAIYHSAVDRKSKRLNS